MGLKPAGYRRSDFAELQQNTLASLYNNLYLNDLIFL